MDKVDQSEEAEKQPLAREAKEFTYALPEASASAAAGEETSRASIIKVPTYGSTLSGKSFEEVVEDEEEAVSHELRAWGGPMALLLGTWMTLMPIFLPLYLTTTMIASTSVNLLLFCATLPELSLRRSVCYVTFPPVILFPTVVRMTALAMVTWRIVRMRLFYVFMRRRVLIYFQPRSDFAWKIQLTQVFFFVMACAHFVLLIAYGPAHGDDGLELPNQKLLTRSVWSFVRHPMLLMTDENEELFLLLADLGSRYIVPGLVAIIFTYCCDDVESYLVPLIKLYEAGPTYVNNLLSSSIAVKEAVARDILENESVSKAVLTGEYADPACTSFRKHALTYEGVYEIGDPSWRHASDGKLESATLKIPDAPPLGILQMLTSVWWPTHIILKRDTKDPGFREAWGFHCSLSAVFIGAEVAWRFYGIWVHMLIDNKHVSPHTYIALKIQERDMGYLIFMFMLLWVCILCLSFMVYLLREARKHLWGAMMEDYKGGDSFFRD